MNRTLNESALESLGKRNWTFRAGVDSPLSETIIFSCVFGLISLAGVVGNVLVILAVSSDSKMRKFTMNALLLNLAVADLSNVIVCVPEFIFQLVNRGWLIPDLFCPLLRFLERVFLYTSLLTQLAVGIERFYAIAYPMKVHILCSRRKVTWWTVFIWMSAMASASPYAVWSDIRRRHCIWGSRLDTNAKLVLQLSECLLFYFVPLILIVVLYSVVSAALWSRHHHLHEGRTDQGPSDTLKTRKNVVKMLILCVSIFFICYSPIQAIVLSAVLFGEPVRFSTSTILALHCLAYSCSSANPIVYTFYSHRFRRKFADLLCCKRKYEMIISTAPTSVAVSANHFAGAVKKNPAGDASATREMTSALVLTNPNVKLLSGRVHDTYASTDMSRTLSPANSPLVKPKPVQHSTGHTE